MCFDREHIADPQSIQEYFWKSIKSFIKTMASNLLSDQGESKLDWKAEKFFLYEKDMDTNFLIYA